LARADASSARWLVLLAVTALSGCSWFSGWFSSERERTPPARETRAAASCPTAAILRPLAETVLFTPGQQRLPAGVAFYGVLSEVDAKCEPTSGGLRLTLDVVVAAERGPAAGRSDAVDFEYFVAVTGPDQAILSKRRFPVRIRVPTTARRGAVSDHIEETVATGGRAPGDLNIVLGFQQSADIVDFYRHFPGR
jgi:hypothetical protein